MIKVLALDLSGITGWAFGSTDGGPVRFGEKRLPKTDDDIGWYLATFRDWLTQLITELQPDEIVFEAPILPEGQGLISRRKLFSLAGLTELICRDLKVPVVEELIDAIREHFIGIARAPKDVKGSSARRKWLKRKTVEKAIASGFKVQSDNEADAIALLSLRLCQLDKNFSLKQTPLFGAAA